MRYTLDVHCHTIASGHAFSTVIEMATYAKSIHFNLIAITDHGPAMPAAPQPLYFQNLKAIPKEISSVKILRGVEVNILDYDGRLDLPEDVLTEMDFVIASFHRPCISPSTIKDHTRVILQLMEKPYIHMIGHPGNPLYPIDIKEMVGKAKNTGTLIEINNSSLKPDSFRLGSKKNCFKILEECYKQQTNIAFGSDAHIAMEVGNFMSAHKMLEELQVTDDLVVNTSIEKLYSAIKNNGQ